MKKTVIFLVLVLMLALTVTACKKKPAANNGTTDASDAGNSSADGTIAAPADDKNDEVSFGTEGDLVVFTASLDFKLEDSTAWLGIIPDGTKYENESEADDVDLIYAYAVNYDDEGKKNYRFEYEKDYFFGIGDGTYDMILTSSDDGGIGKVLLQIGIEIKGEKITLDYENKK